jgi:hypothetical protein
MPISRTIQGFILFDDCDSESGWTQGSSPNTDYTTFSLDTSDKKTGTASFKLTVIPDMMGAWNAYGARYKILNVGSGSGRRVHIWHKFSKSGIDIFSHARAFAIGSGSTGWWEHVESTTSETLTHDWAKERMTLASAGNVLVVLGWCWIKAGVYPTLTSWVDHFVICKGDNVKVTGLTPGQKIKIYRSSDNTLIDTQTCAGGATSVDLSVTNEDFPEQMYLKVYATDGVTLIETTTSYEMCGGDEWAWDSGVGTLKLTSDVVIIYRSAAAGTPKTANLTANLKTTGGENYPGASIQFTTVLGAMTPASDTTDANGNAESALTGTSHGLAIVKAAWLGDATVPACSDYCVVHIFYEAEAGDSDEEYQFFLQGIEYVFVQGRYAWNEQGKRETFEVELPEYVSTITRGGLVSIYRRGVKDFAGILKGRERSLSDAPRVILRGADISILLDRCVELEVYTGKTPQYIINDLLTKYPCGISAGSLGTCAALLTITIDTESLGDAIQRISSAVNWNFRVTLNRTLDFAENFTGGIVPVAFEEGVKILDADWSEDDYSLANWIRMRGDGITSTKQDGAAIAEQGLHQAPAFQKTISDQATLDTMCQALLDLSKTTDETVRVEAIDDYDVGTFATEDQVTVTSETLDLAGAYTIKRIERDMMQGRVVIMDLSNRTKQFWDLDAEYRRMTKDVNV